MANVKITMPEGLMLKLSRLGKEQDRIAAEVLKAGAEIVEDKLRSNLASVVGRNTKKKSRATGELVSSVGTSPVLIGKNGNSNIKVGFGEPHSGGKANAMLASIIEYGKSGQPAKPFMKRTKSQSKKPAEAAMAEKLKQEVAKL